MNIPTVGTETRVIFLDNLRLSLVLCVVLEHSSNAYRFSFINRMHLHGLPIFAEAISPRDCPISYGSICHNGIRHPDLTFTTLIKLI